MLAVAGAAGTLLMTLVVRLFPGRCGYGLGSWRRLLAEQENAYPTTGLAVASVA